MSSSHLSDADREHQNVDQVFSNGIEVKERERFRWGIVERITAAKPSSS